MSVIEEEIDKEIIKCINETAKGLMRSCARSAIHHIERAWKLKEIDPEMAVFRSITAEEEAATAIFIALKEKGYNNAKKLKFKKHVYKQALAPFIKSISKFVADLAKMPGFPFGRKYFLSFEGDGKDKRLKVSFYFHKGSVTAIPPLGFEISKNGKKYHFEDELLEITSGQNKEDIINYIKDITNLRNSLLYARPEGYPAIENKIDGHLDKRRRTVITFLRILSLIYPYKEKALFVQQALNAYLTMMGDIETIIEE